MISYYCIYIPISPNRNGICYEIKCGTAYVTENNLGVLVGSWRSYAIQVSFQLIRTIIPTPQDILVQMKSLVFKEDINGR